MTGRLHFLSKPLLTYSNLLFVCCCVSIMVGLPCAPQKSRTEKETAIRLILFLDLSLFEKDFRFILLVGSFVARLLPIALQELQRFR